MSNVENATKLVRAATLLVVVIVLGVALGIFRACAPAPKGGGGGNAPVPTCGVTPIGDRVELACSGSTEKEIKVCTARGLETLVECPTNQTPPGGGQASQGFKGEAFIDNVTLNDASAADVNDAKDYVYLVATNVWDDAVANGSRYPKEEIAAAVGKAVNQISTERDVYVPQALDQDGTIFRLDRGEIGMSGQEWAAIAKAAKAKIVSQTSKAKLVRQVVGSGNDPAWLYLDDFIEAAYSADIYYQLTEVPATLNQFLQQKGVNLARELQERDGDLALGCVVGSVINASRGTRLVAWAESDDGDFVITFDPNALDPNDPLQKRSCVANPLLNGTGSNKIFEFAASEILYTLRNGGMGGALFAANGQRQNAAPLAVVADNEAPIGVGPEIKLVSCQRCHNEGMIDYKDVVEANVKQGGGGFNAADRDRIKDLYLGNGHIKDLLREHNERFENFAGQAGFDLTQADPVSKFGDQFKLDWDCNRAAARIARTCDELRQAIRASSLAQATIGQLLQDNTLVTADVFLNTMPQLILDNNFFEDP